MASKRRKYVHPLIAALNERAAKERLTNPEIADAIGCDRVTVWRCRKLGRSPKSQRVRRALERYVAKGGGR